MREWWLYTMKLAGTWAPNLFLQHHQHVVPFPKSKWLATTLAFPRSAHIPLAIPQSHGHSLLQRRLRSAVSIPSSHVHCRKEAVTLRDNSRTPPLEALLKGLEFRFWNKIDYSLSVTAQCHMVSEFQLTTTANFRRPHLAGRGVCGMPYGCIMQ